MVRKLQSIVFYKKYWNLNDAIDWLRKHGYRTDLDEKEKTYRFRQEDPAQFNGYETKRKQYRHKKFLFVYGFI